MNRVLYPESVRGLFVTAFYGILDKSTGQINYCCAGHNHPYIARTGGTVEKLDPPPALALCLKDDFQYEIGEVSLGSGDSIFVYSDGVNEAVNEARDEFGVERIQECLRAAAGAKPVAMIRDMLRDVERFSGGIDQYDDITMLTLQYLA